jgi:ammonia channel protein AmtB
MALYYLFEYVFHIDDPLGASAIHTGARIVGVLSVGFFASSEFTKGDAVGVF